MEDYAAGKIGKDSMAIFVDGEKEVAPGIESYSCDISAMCGRKGI